MEVVIKILQFLLSLSILVIIHEFGHFIAAKAFKTRVEKFYLFFNPWFSIFKFKYRETEYGVGWLPLGGYVKISGMIDESMDKEQMAKPPQPWEFRSKTTWQRLIIMLGGVTMNILFAILIYIFMLVSWGEEYLPTSEVKYGITVDSLAMEAGLKDGDKILSIDDEYVENFYRIYEKILIDEAKTIQVERNGEKLNLEIPTGFIGKLVKLKQRDTFIGVRIPCEIGLFLPNSIAKKSGIQLNDRVIAVNDSPIEYYKDFYNEIPKHKNKTITITVVRQSDTIPINLTVPNEGKIGLGPKSLEDYFVFSKIDYNFFEAIPAGVIKAYVGVGNYLKSIKLLFNPEVKVSESVGGFITIGSIFPAEWHWQSFWGLTAFLSIMLAIMNVLPIPALDGGHVMFLMYEIITRRKPSDKFMEYAQIAGMVLLFGLLIFANGNDIIKLFRN
jgi:regulator of sigma E protease